MQFSTTFILILEILYLLTVVSVVVVVISENRNPIKTVAWVLAVLALLQTGPEATFSRQCPLEG